MFEGTKRKSAPFWIPPLDILKLLGLFACVGLSLFRACTGPVAAPLTIDAPTKQLAVGARGEVIGTAAPGSTVSVYQGDQFLGSTVARTDGTWNFALPALAAGSYAISARSEESSAAAPVSVDVVEAALPAAPEAPTAIQEKPRPATAPVILTPLGGAVLPQNALGNVEGTANSGNTVAVFDGDVKIGEATTGPNGRWSLALPALSVGAHRLMAKATGGDGAEVASFPVQVNVTAPVAPTATSLPAPTAAPAATATTAAPTPEPVATATTAAAPAATATTAAPAATATTAAAPEATATTATTTTAESPAPAAEPPAIAASLDGAKVPSAKTTTLSGEADAGSVVEVSVDGAVLGETTADSAGQWTIEAADLKPGEHVISAKDANGAAEDATITVLAPLAAPVITNIKNGSKVEAGKPLAVAGTGPASSTITVYQGDAELGKTESNAKGAWKLTPSKPIEAGKYEITAVASNEAAGESVASNVVEIEAGLTVLLPTTGGE